MVVGVISAGEALLTVAGGAGGAGYHQCWSSGWGGRASLPSSMLRVRVVIVDVDGTAGRGC